MPTAEIKAAFQQRVVMLPLESIVPQRSIAALTRKTQAYRQIASSLEHVGLIEPVVVYPRAGGDFLLLDGHLRHDILKRSGTTEIRAILATDDEAYTYNKRVNHLPPIAQHFMIRKALANGLTEEKIAAALNVNIANIRKKRDMLEGICPEVVEMLRNRHVTADAIAVLRKMKPIRQIQAAEHMCATGTYSGVFARALLEVTKPEFLLDVPADKQLDASSLGAQAMLEHETETLLRDLKAVEESYGTDILTLSISCAYVERLLVNANVERHLAKNHSEILTALRVLLSQVKPEVAKTAAS